MNRRLRRILSSLQRTPLHPQWFALYREPGSLRATCGELSGTVLDVGCAKGTPRRYLQPGASYIGLDYHATATAWYQSRPDVFGDAHRLPVRDGSVDHALLLDVLEHLSEPDRCLRELHRALRPGGTLTIQVPFLYPVHDAPRDFSRWTRYGLRSAAARTGFEITSERSIGQPLETAALNLNIAASQTLLNWIRTKNPLLLLIALLPFLVFTTNALAWLFSRLGPEDDLMPYAYRMTWIRR